MAAILPPQGVKLTADIEHRPGAGNGGHRARVRWIDPTTRKRRSQSDSFATDAEARAWIAQMQNFAAGGVDPATANQDLGTYGTANMRLVLRGWKRRRRTRTSRAGASGSCPRSGTSPSA